MSRDLRALCIVLAVTWPAFGAVAVLLRSLLGTRISILEVIGTTVAWGVVSLLTPPVVFAVNRIQSGRCSRLRAALCHAALASAFVIAHALIFVGLESLAGLEPLGGLFIAHIRVLSRYDIINYSLIVFATCAVRQRAFARRAEKANLRLTTRLAQAALEQVRVAVDPPMVVKALGEIHDEIDRDPVRAESQILDLCRGLREKLQRVEQRTVNTDRRHADREPIARPRTAVMTLGLGLGSYCGVVLFTLDSPAGPATWQQAVSVALLWGGPGPLTAAAVQWLVKSLKPAATALALCVGQGVILEGVSVLLAQFGFGRPFGETLVAGTMLAGVCSMFVFFNDWQRRRRRYAVAAEAMNRMLAEAQLTALRSQLAPHFLFNALNSVISQVDTQPEGAKAMLRTLADVLRSTAAEGRHKISLREDLQLTSSYLAIEKVRFRDALEIAFEVDPALLDAQVPAFLIQPLVENAVRHGSLGTIGRGTVRVTIRRETDRLAIAVENDGELIDPSSWTRGIGLSNVDARLRQLYGEEHELSIAAADNSVRVRVAFPLTMG